MGWSLPRDPKKKLGVSIGRSAECLDRAVDGSGAEAALAQVEKRADEANHQER